ncbi:MAG: hypothetical protein ABII06_15290, partial [Pseudomonadota bacterium]
MNEVKRPAAEKRIIFIVLGMAFIFLAGGISLGFWSAREMKNQVSDQFNEEQLVIARNISDLIQRELIYLKREMILLRKDLSREPFDPGSYNDVIQKSLSRVLEIGVFRIELIDFESKIKHIYMPHRYWSTKENFHRESDDFLSFNSLDPETPW